jgi:hypothetical protein
LIGLLLGASRNRERTQHDSCEFCAADDAHKLHSAASIVPLMPDMVGPWSDLAAPSLSEGSVNLDEALQRSPKPTDHP